MNKCMFAGFTDGCPVPTAPSNGLIGPVVGRTVGSMVTFQCDSGFVPLGDFTATCLDTLTWGPGDPAIFECNEQPPVANGKMQQTFAKMNVIFTKFI